MLRIVISNITRPKFIMLTDKFVYQFIDEQKSMISNLSNCRSLNSTLSYYASIKPFMLPRTVSILSRKLVHLVAHVNINYLQHREKQIFMQIVQDIINIQYKMLTPYECNNVLYFIYSLKHSLKSLFVDMQRIKKLQMSLIDQIMINIEYVSFNNLVDFFALLRSNEGSTENIKMTYRNLQRAYPSREADQIDSFFHITRLLSILFEQQNSLIGELLKKASLSMIKFQEYLPKYVLVDTINILLGKYFQFSRQPLLYESIKPLLINLMKNLASQASKLEVAEFNNVATCIEEFVKQIEKGEEMSKQSIASTAVQINKLKKVYYRQSQIKPSEKLKFYKLKPPKTEVPQGSKLFKSKDSF